MEALFIVLNHESHFNDLLKEFSVNDIRGGTILDSQGLGQSMAEINPDFGFSYFRLMLNQGRPYNKTIFLVLDEEHIEIAKNCVRKVLGDISQANMGVMFTFKVTSFEGLTK